MSSLLNKLMTKQYYLGSIGDTGRPGIPGMIIYNHAHVLMKIN